MAENGGVRSILADFSGRTSMHGLGTLASAGSIKGKLFWSIVCLASMAMFLFMLSRIVKQYLAYPVNIIVEEVSYFYMFLFFCTFFFYCKGQTINDLGGGLGQKREKKAQRLLAPGKKTSSASWPGKKTKHEFSAQGPPPDKDH